MTHLYDSSTTLTRMLRRENWVAFAQNSEVYQKKNYSTGQSYKFISVMEVISYMCANKNFNFECDIKTNGTRCADCPAGF